MYECACGFTSGTAEAFFKHISRYQVEGDNSHYLTNKKQVEEQLKKEGSINASGELVSLTSSQVPTKSADAEVSKEDRMYQEDQLTTKSSEAEILSEPSEHSDNVTQQQIIYQDTDAGQGYHISPESGISYRLSDAFQWTFDAVQAVAIRAQGTIGFQGRGDSTEIQNADSRDWRNGTKVKDLEDLLLWKDVGSSCRVLLLGLYFIVFGRSLVHVGFEFVQPSSFAAIIVLMWMLFSFARRLRQEWRQSVPDAPDFHFSVDQFLDTICNFFGSWTSAAMTLAFVHVIQGSYASRLLVWILIWIFVFVGEVRLLSQEMTFAAMFASMFLLPVWYVKSKQEIEYLTAQLGDVSKALARQNFKFVLISALVAIVTAAAFPVNTIIQLCVAVLVFVVMMLVGAYRTLNKSKSKESKIVNGGYVYLDHRDTSE